VRFKSDGYASLTRCVVHDDGCPFVVFETDGKGWIITSWWFFNWAPHGTCYQSNLSKNSAGVRVLASLKNRAQDKGNLYLARMWSCPCCCYGPYTEGCSTTTTKFSKQQQREDWSCKGK